MKKLEQIKELLTHFSLTEDEIDIYLAALSLKKATISQLARRVSKSRTASHFQIQKLLSKKILRLVALGKRNAIVPVPPRELVRNIHEKTSSLENLIPQLEALGRIYTDLPSFEISESREGYWKIYEEISYLPIGTTIRMLEGKRAVENELALLFPHQWEEFWARIIERNIQTKGLFTDELIASTRRITNESQRAYLRKRVWHMRSLPHAQLPIDQLMIIYKDKAAFLFPDTALVLVLEHRGIVGILGCLFDSLYDRSKPVRDPWSG